MKDIDDMDKAIEDIMERFRSGEMDDIEEHGPEECRLIMQEAVKYADGEITVKVKRTGQVQHIDMHVKGNPAAVLVATYCMIDRVVENSPGITFEDVIEMMRYMEENRRGSEGPEVDRE